MANECHVDDNELEQQVKPIHFFKVIVPHSLQEGKLMIPKKFVEKYGEGLPRTVFLKPPNGVEWKVNLEEHDGKIWFQKGWKEFAKYHSLAPWQIVVFRYEGTSNFQLHIFDKSALEIDYPFKRVEGKRASNDQGNKPPMFESLEGYTYRPSQKRKDECSLEFLQQSKKSSRCVEVESISNLSKENLQHTGKKCKEEPKTSAKQITAVERANSFKPCNPSCLVVMHPSYIHSCANLNLPSKFCKRYFDLNKMRGDINLRLANGRVWPARYLIRKIDTKAKFELSSGWKTFVKDNNLEVGDACTFELIDRTKLTFQVYIFRETDNSNCPTSEDQKPMNAAKSITALERARSFKPCNPFFLIVMYPSSVHSRSCLNLPFKFCKVHFDLGKKRGDINLQLLNGRVWPARYLIMKCNTRTKIHISSGWDAFAKENDLKVGDVCTFELIDKTKLTFQVYIFRETDNSNCPSSQGREELKTWQLCCS